LVVSSDDDPVASTTSRLAKSRPRLTVGKVTFVTAVVAFTILLGLVVAQLLKMGFSVIHV
jgi:hypothetical protein